MSIRRSSSSQSSCQRVRTTHTRPCAGATPLRRRPFPPPLRRSRPLHQASSGRRSWTASSTRRRTCKTCESRLCRSRRRRTTRARTRASAPRCSSRGANTWSGAPFARTLRTHFCLGSLASRRRERPGLRCVKWSLTALAGISISPPSQVYLPHPLQRLRLLRIRQEELPVPEGRQRGGIQGVARGAGGLAHPPPPCLAQISAESLPSARMSAPRTLPSGGSHAHAQAERSLTHLLSAHGCADQYAPHIHTSLSEAGLSCL